MRDFAKLYSTILDSSVWGESKDVKILWVTLLAMGAEKGGLIEASVGGLARRAGLTREECEAALETLLAPDEDDKSGVDEGRRLQKTERGWRITNHQYYRDFRTEKQVQDAERQQRKRERDKSRCGVTQRDVTESHATSPAVAPDLELELERDPEEIPPPKDLTGHGDVLPPVVVVPQSAEERIPCPPDLKLTETQRVQFQQGTGASDYQVEQLELRFRMASATAATRPRAAWQASIGKAVAAEFSNGRRRPPRAPDAESGTHQAARLRHGPRQPNAVDHTTLSDDEHLRRIGGTSA